MVRALVGLLGKNPFKPLQAHMKLVTECVELVRPLMEAVIEGDLERIAEVRKQITKAEHEADLAKDQLRDNMPRTVFLPVSRTDLLELLHNQDDIADGAEDAAILASMKPLAVPPEMRDEILQFVEICLNAARSAEHVVGRLDELVETGFAGPEAEEVLELIKAVGQQEWEADKAGFKLTRSLLAGEQRPDCIDVFLWMKLFEALGDIANAAEQVGNYLRLMLSR